ncbi:hypothetical protein EYR41_005439 [Orbilia oligospora]|uniref:DUF7905 domain-containing protein n=1 Tax=Orbilia oligospora TaxID=2813651 RepID=A0A7C8PF20_ORBOL|nr:hypothetical protein TWF751_003879 [Orbilia oligospora]TGJ69393.1 hypothetical protein EYR41_005439 [Orbilia oligospora]
MMHRNWYKNIVPPPGSEAGTSMTDASSLPQDPEFANANIWNQDNVPTEAELQAQGEQKAEEVDKWIQDLYQQNSAVHKAVEEGIRTTDITRQFYEEAPLITAPPTPEPSSDQEQAQASSSRILTFGEIRKDRQNVQGEVARFPAPGRVAPEISTRKKGKNRKAQPQVQEVQIKPTQALAPQTQPNRVEPQLSFEQNVEQPAPVQPRKFEGPTHDVRKMNYGDNCARENPTGPTDYYLFPVRAGEKPQQSKRDRYAPPDMETRIIGAERHHILAIADVTGTHIKFPQDDPQDFNHETGALSNRVRIWGARSDVEKAKVYLMYLNKHADKDVQSATKKALGWAKVKALPGQRHRDAATKQEKEQEEKNRYKLPSKNDENFPFTGAFAWPQTEVNPADVLGMNYESLDPVRHDNGVYIVYSYKRHCFRVLGYSQESIDRALDRIYVVFCEIAARNRPQINYTLIQPPRVYCPQVSMDPEHGLGRIIDAYKPSYDSAGVEARLADDGTLDHEPNWEAKRQTLSLANDSYIRAALDNCLKDLNYLRMYAKLRIYFGSLILFGYRRPKYTLHAAEEFREMMKAKLAKNELVRHIGSAEAGHRLRDYCDSFCYPLSNSASSTAVLSPANSRDAEGVMEPDYSTSMYLLVNRRPDPVFELKLEVDFRKSPTGAYTVAARRWLRIPRTETNGSNSVTKKRMPLDLKVVNLDMGVAYQFDLTLGQPFIDFDKMPILNEFVLHLELVNSRDGGNKRVSYIQLPGIKVTNIITKTRYPYYFVGSHYIFEITQYEHIRANEEGNRKPAVNLPSGGFPADYSHHSTTDTLWGASVYNKEWDAAFAKQVDLPIGYAGDWQPSVESFLSDTGKKIFDHGVEGKGGDSDETKTVDGFSELLQKIEFGVKAFYEVKKMVFGDQTRKFIKFDGRGERATPPPIQRPTQHPQPEMVVHGIDRQQSGFESQPLTGLSGSAGDKEYEFDEPAEDIYKGMTAGQRLAMKLGRTKPNPVTAAKSAACSIYGDSEYSQAVKEREGLFNGSDLIYEEEDDDSLYTPPPSRSLGARSRGILSSEYGDSEFSAEAKEREGLH